MGARLSSKLLRRSASVSSASSGEPGSTHFAFDDLKRVIRKRPELKKVAEDFLNSIVPRIKRCLSDIDRGVYLSRDGVIATIRAALVVYQMEKESKERPAARRQSRRRILPLTQKTSRRKNIYDDTVAELRKLKVAGLAAEDLPALRDELKDAMDKLRQWKQRIEKRLRSKRRWRKAWSVVLNVAVVGVLVASVLLAVVGAGPGAIAGATAGATVMKAALEPFVSSILDDKERALEEEKKIVEMMRDGEYSLVHELESVRSLADRAAAGVNSLVDCVEMALEATEEAVEVAMDALAKKIGDVESSLEDLKMKVRSCQDKLQRFESKFISETRN